MSIAVHMELCSGFQPSRLLYGGVPGSQVSTTPYRTLIEPSRNPDYWVLWALGVGFVFSISGLKVLGVGLGFRV